GPRAAPHHPVLTSSRPLGVILGALSVVFAVIPVLDPFRDIPSQIEGPVRPLTSWIAADGLKKIVREFAHLSEQSQRGAWFGLPPGKRPLVRPAGGLLPLSLGRKPPPVDPAVGVGIDPGHSDDRTIG